MRESPPVRFWERGVRTPKGCLEWAGARHEFGYGIVGFAGKTFRAHRVAYWLVHGPFDERQMVLHKCDNPACFDAKHLFLGSAKSNHDDCRAKGRHVNPPRLVGEKNHAAKLTARDVKQIRRLLLEGKLTQREIAKRFGVTKCPIQRIANQKGWKCV